jgi:hypothetical protein
LSALTMGHAVKPQFGEGALIHFAMADGRG